MDDSKLSNPPSTYSAIRVISKTLSLSIVACIFLRNSPQFLGVLLGIFMQGIAFSWLYLVGTDCAKKAFFQNDVANSMVGTIALVPLLRPFRLLRDKGFNESRAIISLMLSNLFGMSVSHFAVDCFLLVAVPLMWWKLGWWGILKFWLLPLLFAHYNVGAYLKNTPSSLLLYPELKNLVKQESSIAFYNLERLAEALNRAKEKTPFPKLPAEAQSRLKGVLDSFRKPFWNTTREVLLWRKRDWVLHSFLLAGALSAMLHHSFLRSWSYLPVLFLLPLLVVKSQASNIIACAVTRKKIPAPGTQYTLEQLREYPQLAAVHEIVFDLEEFAEKHPGGDQILAAGGTDCTGLFGSMHAFTAKSNLKKLEAYQVGTLKRLESSEVAFDFDTAFARDLKVAVKDALKGRNPYAPTEWWLRTAFIMTATLIAEYAWIRTGHWLAVVVTGVLHAAIGICVQHDASHGAVSSNAAVNAIVSYGADWIGNCRWLWMQQHVIGHHPHCNMEGKDPDAHSAEPFLQFHWSPDVVRQWFIKHQWVYMFLVLPWYGPTVVYNVAQLTSMNHGDETPTSHWMLEKRSAAVFTRLLYIARLVIAPIVIGQASWVLGLLGVPLVTGAVLTFVFVVSHNFEGSDRVPVKESNNKVDFYKLQVETSCTYGGELAMVLTGGLNLQIEHHLFPRVNSWHYPAIHDAVRQVCKKHDVKYTYFSSLLANVMSTVRYMKFVGEKVTDEKVEEPATPQKKLVIHFGDQALDVTNWAKRHPGGPEILEVFENRDCTDQFMAMHTEAAKRQLSSMLKSSKLTSTLPEKTKQDPVAVSYAELRDELQKDGHFEVPFWTEVFRLFCNLSCYAGGFILMTQLGYHWAGAMLYAWGMQQSGWLSHDYLHHSLSQNVAFCDGMGTFLGWLQGYDSMWWKYRHNLHHVSTNEEGNDPDIDLAPLLTYMNARAPTLNWFQRWQYLYFLPILSFLHVSWCVSSIRHTVSRGMWKRVALLAVHHLLIYFVIFRAVTGEFLWLHYVVAVLFKGMATAIFVFSTHYPEVRVPPGANSMSFAEQTALTSRNIGGGYLIDWFSGNISRQIEHHLFPTLPRANLVAIAPKVKKMLAKHNIPYVEENIWKCMIANMDSLMEKEGKSNN